MVAACRREPEVSCLLKGARSKGCRGANCLSSLVVVCIPIATGPKDIRTRANDYVHAVLDKGWQGTCVSFRYQ